MSAAYVLATGHRSPTLEVRLLRPAERDLSIGFTTHYPPICGDFGDGGYLGLSHESTYSE